MRSNPLSFVGLFLCIALCAGCRTVPGSGRQQILLLSEGEEMRMGIQAWDTVLKENKRSSNKSAVARVERVGKRIAAAAKRPDFDWEFVVIESEAANAFCLPGGKIAVYTGILPLTKTDTGLAVVMGHEVAHALARHGGERVSQQLLINTGVSAVSKALGKGDAKTVKAVQAAFGIGAALGVALPFSRAHESEADQMGLTLMATAGYNPTEAINFWGRMAKAGGSGAPEILSTHPSHKTRIQQIRRWLPKAKRIYEAKKK